MKMMMMMKKTITTAWKALSEINVVSSELKKQYSSKMGEERHSVEQ